MKKISLTQGKEAIVDDEDFEWLSKIRWRSDDIGGGRHYAATGTPVRMHRMIMNPGPGQVVDHINGDTLDNRRSNLRLCSHTQNMANSRRFATNKSGFIGVSRKRKRWVAFISINDHTTYLGTFDTAEEAAIARDKVALKLRAEFAVLNFGR